MGVWKYRRTGFFHTSLLPYFHTSLRRCFRTCTTAAALLFLTACGPDHELSQFSGPTMGTTYSVKITELPETVALDELQREIESVLEEVNRGMSTYRADSQISFINRKESEEPVMLMPEVYTVLQEAVQVSKMTRGAFDITVAPLVDLWGFGPQQRPDEIPSDEEIARALERTGMDKIELSGRPPALRKIDPWVTLDLSGVAKGYAVDRVAETLDNHRIGNYLVEIGGELRGRGVNAEGRPWRIAIEKPDPGGRQALRVIEPGKWALATSGDYRNYFEKDGVRYSHTIDPRTGRPVTHDLVSVTVAAPTCMRADALATALMVLGPDEGESLARLMNRPAFFVIKTDDGFRTSATPEFEDLLVK